MNYDYVDSVMKEDYQSEKAGVNVDYDFTKFTGVDYFTDHAEMPDYNGSETKA